eukprot:NODE_324_length_10963_cov_0.175350.p3 type:complete len:497 gc:universal NODE_324_length_10963_cov_0.175350:8720-10210(+)
MEATFLSDYSCLIKIDHLKFSVNSSVDDVDFILITDFKYISTISSKAIPLYIEDGCYEHGKIMLEEMNIFISGDFRTIRYYEEFRFDELVIKAISSQLFFASSGFFIQYGSYKFVIVAPGVPHYTLEMPFIQDLDALILLDVVFISNNFNSKLKNMQLCIQDAVNNKTPVILTCSPIQGYLFDLLFLLSNVQYFTPSQLYLLFSTGIKSYTLINSIPESLNNELKNKAFLGKYGCDLKFDIYPNCFDSKFQSKWLQNPGIILTMCNYATQYMLNSFNLICKSRNQQGLHLNVCSNEDTADCSSYSNVESKNCNLDARMSIHQALLHFKADTILSIKSSTATNDELMNVKMMYPNICMQDIDVPFMFEIRQLTMSRLVKFKQLENANWHSFNYNNAEYRFVYVNGSLVGDMINMVPINKGILFGRLNVELIRQACLEVFYSRLDIQVEQVQGITQISVGDMLMVQIQKGNIMIESDELDMIEKLQQHLLDNKIIKRM